MRLPRVSPAAVRNIALATMILYALLMLTGGGVRLTGSGLGCPDWPTCYQHRITAVASFHPMVEFLNRLVTVLITVISILAIVLAWLRTPRRRDLVLLATGIIGGLAGQIVLGGIVVLTKLNPYLVSLHFLLTIVIIAVAVAFFHRSRLAEEDVDLHARPLVGRDLVWLARLLLTALGLVTVIGTVVAGAGPHAGAPSTPGSPIRRIAIAFRDIAQLHTDAALFLVGLTLASLFAFHHADAPAGVQRHLRILFEVMVLQGAVGYTQYFLHDAAGIVEIHILGVTVLWLTALAFYLALHEHHALAAPSEPEPALAAVSG